MKNNKVKHVCSECGTTSWLSSNWSITRKKHPLLCGECSHKKSYLEKGPVHYAQTAKNWADVYNDPSQTSNTLKEAKQDNKQYYKRDCSIHGPMPYATLDNTCRKCTKEQAKVRNINNKEFNRPRVILGSARRRSRQKNIPFNLKLQDVRDMIPTECPILGFPLSYDLDYDTSPSLDRFNSGGGYTTDNVTIISNRANRLKNNGSAEEHLKIAVWMLKQQQVSLQGIQQIFQDMLADS